MAAVAVGLDHRQGWLAVQGWTEATDLRLLDVLSRYPAASAFIVTDISRDGTLVGPDLVGLAEVVAASSVPVIASGGVAALDDLVALCAIAGLAGVIAGKALYEQRFTLAEAMEAAGSDA